MNLNLHIEQQEIPFTAIIISLFIFYLIDPNHSNLMGRLDQFLDEVTFDKSNISPFQDEDMGLV